MKYLKSIITVSFTILIGLMVSAQKSSNYSLTTDRNGSIESMSGASTLIAADNTEDSYTPVFAQLGFRFLYMGEFWDEFKVSANGIIWFGKSSDFFPQGANNIGSIPNSRRISGLANLNGLKTHQTVGKVAVKTFGAAPNRYAIIQWTNMSANSTSTSEDITYQVKLHESEYNSSLAGEFEFIYDKVQWGVAFASEEATCGFQTTNQADKRFMINIHDDSYSTTTDLRNSIESGLIPNLEGSGVSNKKRYHFTATDVISSASPIGVSCLSSNSVLLTWKDNSADNLGYAIYLSTDGKNYDFIQNEGPDDESTVLTGLLPNTLYWARIHAYNEGKLDPVGAIATFTTREFGNITAITSGKWSEPATWSSNTVPVATDDVTIGCIGNYTVTVDVDAVCNNLAIEAGSSLAFDNNKALTVNASITNSGTVDYSASNTAITISGDCVNTGKWEAGSMSETNFVGSSNQNLINTAIPNSSVVMDQTGSVGIKNNQWSQLQLTVPAGAYVALSEVKIEILHTNNSDLDIYLRNPDGERIQLANNHGGNGDNYSNVIFSDDASNSLPFWNTEISGTFLPFESLSGFSLLNGGTWILEVFDGKNKNTGTITQLSLGFELAGTETKITFNDLSVDKTAGELLVATNVEMSGHLGLSAGVINLFSSGSYQLYLYEDASSDIATNSSYVFGKIVKQGNNDFTFPVGDGGFAANADLFFAGGNAKDEFSVTYFHQSPIKPNPNDPGAPYGAVAEGTVVDVSENEYWLIEQERNANSPVYINLSYEDGRSGSINDPSELIVIHMTDDGAGGKHWKNEGRGLLTAAKVRSLNPISSFSPFTIGSGSEANVLPVNWLSFEVSGTDNIAEIRWSAIEHAENDYYQLQRSFDGINYENIDIVDINAEGKQTYSYKNVLPFELAGTEIFYRIKQYDIDGSSIYSGVDSYTVILDDEFITIFPVPVTDLLTLEINDDVSNISIEIFSAEGQVLRPQVSPKGKRTNIDFSKLKTGTYVVSVIIGKQKIHKLVVKP